MKPLGTITMCFPHVEDETSSILQSVMDEATNYHDFTERLCELVCAKQASSEILYFAFYHAYNMELHPLLERFFKLEKLPIYLDPLLLAARVFRGEPIEMSVMEKSLTKALRAIPNDWLACHLYLEWRRTAETFYPEIDTDNVIIQSLVERIENDKAFECFRPRIFSFKAYQMLLKGDHTNAVDWLNKSILLARKYDDLPFVADMLYHLSRVIISTDVSEALELMAEERKIGDLLEYRFSLVRTSETYCQIMTLRGEYDESIRSILDYHEALQMIDYPYGYYLSLSLALVYNLMGDGKSACRYLDLTKEKVHAQKRYKAYYHLLRTFALVNLGKEVEALSHLGRAKQYAIKSGVQRNLEMYHLLEGLLEKVSGDLQSAKYSLEKLLEHFDDENHLYKNLCLFYLSDIEVDEHSSMQHDHSNSWLHTFEVYAEERDYPGFFAQAKILRAKHLRKHGEYKKSQTLIDEVLETARLPSMTYLNRMIDSYLPQASG